jgi:AcrR family transcriptional regulator
MKELREKYSQIAYRTPGSRRRDMTEEKERFTGTKRKIIEAAVILFSENGFTAVATRDIAKAVNLKASSLYSHFASKSDILTAIYELYDDKANKLRIDMSELYRMAETENPIDVLYKTQFFFAEEDQELMDRIIVIAALENRNDKRSEEFLVRNLIDFPLQREGELLHYMQDLGRIEPLNIEDFLVVMSNFCYSAAVRNFTGHPVTMEEWRRGCRLLYANIIPTGK